MGALVGQLLLSVGCTVVVMVLPDADAAPRQQQLQQRCPSNWTVGTDVNCCNLAQSGPHTQDECCAMCEANPKCAAAVWNAGSDRWCNLKWSTAQQKRSKAGEMLVRIRANQPHPGPAPAPTHPVRPPPAALQDWLSRYNAGHLLYADAAAVATPLQQHIMPEVGNGYLAAQAHGRPSIVGDYLMVGGVYNGRADSGDKELDGPSHRAMIPSFLPSIAGAATATVAADTALDIERAAFITRGTTADGHVTVEHRLYAHWTRPHLLVQEFHLSTGGTAAEVSFTAPHDEALWSSGKDFQGQTLSPPPQEGLRVVQGQTRISETPDSNTTRVAMVSTAPLPIKLAAHTNKTVYVLHAVSTSLNGTVDPAAILSESMAYHRAGVVAASTAQLWAEHTHAWEERWAAGRIEIGGDLALAQSTNSSLYFLLSAIREDWVFGLSPGGLASSAYYGHVFWDMDTWMYPPLAVLHPELGRGCLAYRMARAPVARLNAQAHGFNGTMFPWESSLTGIETSPAGDGTHGACSAANAPPPPPPPSDTSGQWFDAELGRPQHDSDKHAAAAEGKLGRKSVEVPRVSSGNAYGDCEQHINADISFATRQMWQLSHDKTWLADTGYPLAEGIAEFWASKAIKQPDNLYHILKTMGPDEFHQLTDDNAYTNSAAAIALEFAAAAAETLGQTPPKEWREIASKMFVPYDAAKDYHPEYEHYYPNEGPPTGAYAPPEVVKQGDTILMGFPLGVNMSASTRRNDLNMYNNVTTATGPAMTWAMFAVGYLDIGDEVTAQAFFSRGYANALNGAFGVWQETPHGGAVNFLTGAGGFLQSLIFGYGGLRLSEDALLLRPPHPPGNATSVGLHGVDYLGVPLAITATADTLIVERLSPLNNGAEKLLLSRRLFFKTISYQDRLETNISITERNRRVG
jgi:trehalose/maltose hydrolase-like predicted phosphorylase